MPNFDPLFELMSYISPRTFFLMLMLVFVIFSCIYLSSFLFEPNSLFKFKKEYESDGTNGVIKVSDEIYHEDSEVKIRLHKLDVIEQYELEFNGD
jgi:hypothetical protein